MTNEILTIRGTNIPRLGFGTWRLRDKAAIDAIRHALDTGYRHIDTAQIYENEHDVGKALAGSGVPREDIFLTTKVWMDSFRNGDLQRSVAQSLKKLKTDYVDLLLLHWPQEEVPLAETMAALMEVRDSGKARHIGVSNFTVALMREAYELSGGAIITNQVEYHPFISQQKLLDWARSHDMFLTSYSPLARADALQHETITAIAAAHDKTPGQVVLRWHIQQDKVCAIPKSGNPARIRENFEIFDFALSNEEMAQISGLARQDGRMIDPEWAPEWDRADAA